MAQVAANVSLCPLLGDNDMLINVLVLWSNYFGAAIITKSLSKMLEGHCLIIYSSQSVNNLKKLFNKVNETALLVSCLNVIAVIKG